MTLKQKSLNCNYPDPGSVLLNLCIYLFISSVIYHLFSLNINLLKLTLLCSGFILVFYLSSKKTELILQKMQLKNIIVLSKFFLGIITLSSAVLIYNNFSFSSIFLYLLILTTAILYAVLNKANNIYYKKITKKNKKDRSRELITQFNIEKLLLVIMAAPASVYIKIGLNPLILLGTAVYYFISAYINTFQEI